LSRRAAAIVLLILSILLIVARLRSYDEPPEWDIGTYQAIAREMLNGERLYADAWDVKPPGIFVTFATTQFFTGDGALPVYLLSVAMAIVTMFGVYSAASVAGRAAGMWAALFWAAMCFEPWTGGNLPNTEVFINACSAWAFAIWLRSRGTELSWRRAAAIGLLFAVASLYKQVAIVIPTCIGVAFLGTAVRATLARHAAKLFAAAAIVVLIWSAVLAYFAATGRGWLAWQTFFVAPRAYSGSMIGNLAASILPQNMVSKYLIFALPAMALTIIGAFGGERAAPRRAWALFAGLVVGTHLAVALPGQFHGHYYQLWFVPLAIGAGWGAAALPKRVGARRTGLAYAVGLLALLAMIVPQASWYALSGREWARRKYGDFFIAAQDSFRAVDRMLPKDETFYTWSDEAYAYALIHRRPPATALWKMHTTTGPLADWLTRRTLADLQKNPPAMIILYGEPPGPTEHPILEWTRQHYELMPDERREYFPLTLYVRRK
jgi:4-amino-4-deoxy-L-arabinose transferase-like glycosyltransferase